MPTDLANPAMPCPRLRCGRSRGFTLVEILVALGLFALGAVGVIAIFGAGTATARQAVDTLDATTLLDSVLNDLEATWHDEAKYWPVDFPAEIEGWPAGLLAANDGEMPDLARNIVMPRGWPGRYEVDDRRTTGRLGRRMTYSIWYEPLPGTVDPTGRPVCVLAHVTVYWTRGGTPFTLRGTRVLVLPEP